MMKALLLLSFAVLVTGPVLAVSHPAHAEGEAAEEETLPPKTKKLKKASGHASKPAPKPATLPAAPIPYVVYNGPDAAAAKTEVGAHDIAAHVPPAMTPELPMPQATTPQTWPQPPETTLPAALPPVVVVPSPPEIHAQPPAQTEISLRCETKTTQGKKLISQGSFYINLFPSPVFPDQSASFQFLQADPNHASLVRGSMCFDTLCSAQVSGSAYYLVNRVNKKGAALRITLDRVKGAFYAEEIEKGLIGGAHLGEQGYCTPQTLPGVKF